MRRGRILILLGLLLAIGTAAIVFILLQGATGEQVAEIEREEVLVAAQPIPEDELVEGRLEIRSVPVEVIPEGALRDLDSTAGMMAKGPIYQGAIIHPDLLISPMELAREGELGKLIEVGYEAVAFPIDELSSVSYGIQPGDYVDILMTFSFLDVDQETQIVEPLCPPDCGFTGEGAQEEALATEQNSRLVTQLTLQDAAVLGVGRWSFGAPIPAEQTPDEGAQGETLEPEIPSYITLMLTPQDALVLKLARESGASIDLAVRAQEDHQSFATQQVTLDYIMARFGISLPVKQPYTVDKLERGDGFVSPP